MSENAPPDMHAFTTLYGVDEAKRPGRPHRCDLCDFEHASTPNVNAHEAWVRDQAGHGFVRAHECGGECLGVTTWAVQHPDDVTAA